MTTASPRRQSSAKVAKLHQHPDSGAIHALSSNGVARYAVTLGDTPACTCIGFSQYGHCYHLAGVCMNPTPETPFYDAQRGGYRPLPPRLPARYALALPALASYTARTLGRADPHGRRDSAGRWYPAESERRPCCDRVRSPSRRFPYSLVNHCRTAGHCAALHDVSPKLLRGLLASVVRYYTPTGSAPDLCPVCGASWACAHRPWSPPAGMKEIAPDSETLSERDPDWRNRPGGSVHDAAGGYQAA